MHNLSAVLSSIDSEQREAGKTLSTMREVIKAMNKCSKISTGTQVEEGELEAKVGKIFENQ